MATILCALSGIEYKTEHMSIHLTSRESHHPIFDIPATKLLQLTPRWLNQELSETENYLLYLALFNSTGLIQFRVPAIRTAALTAIIAQNMAPLADIVERIISSGTTKVTNILHLPSYIISPETSDLSSSADWIEIWNNCYTDYLDNYKTSTALEKLTRQETILERLIKDRTKDISSYAGQLAKWAADAGNFPECPAGLDASILSGKQMSLSSYWQHIIKCCAKYEAIWEIPGEDIKELIEHCEDTIFHGSIYAHELMTLLRAGYERKNNFLNLGDMDIGANGANTYRILDASASIEDANKLALIDSAPANPPIESNYPNKLAFLRAKLNYSAKKNEEEKIAINNALNAIGKTNNPILGKL